jgi:hypothetical protein
VNKRLTEIARRKQALVAECDREREELAALWGRLRLPAAASIGLLLGKVLKAHPLLFTGVTGWLVSRRVNIFTRAVRGLKGVMSWWRSAYPPWSSWSKRRGRK